MSDIYKLDEGFEITSTPKFTKDGHMMFLSDVEKDLNYWRNKALELQAENAELKNIHEKFSVLVRTKEFKQLLLDNPELMRGE